MKIVFFIECLRSGGKERRLIELVKVISKMQDYTCKIVIIDDIVYYEKQIPSNVELIILGRKYFRKDLSIFLKFCKICSVFSPDIIHVWGNMPAIYAIPAKLLYNIPMINSQITDAPDSIPKGLLSPKTAFRFSSHIIANSFAGLNAYKAPIKKSSVIYNGFNFNRIINIKSPEQIRNQFRINTKYVIGMVASFSSLKDYFTFINSGIIVLQEFPDTTILCIGDGDNTPFKSIIPSINSTNFIFLGKQPEIESIINLFDIGILSTYTEGISNAIMEYMALGKPVVATQGGGTAELVIQNETGFLVQQKNEKLLAEKILILLRDSGKRDLMGGKGKVRIETEFKIEKMINKHIELYLKYRKCQ
jgi:glycosyltransferase involved in cell wall biosynthesis